MRRIVLATTLALLLAACGRNANNEYASSPAPPPPADMPAPAMPMAKLKASSAEASVAQDALGGVRNIAPNEPGGGQPVIADSRQIAYTYTRTLRAPTSRMQDLLNAHKAACDAAGPAKCYVSNSSISGLGTDGTSGTLELHATPEWIKPFLEGLPESLKPFDANVDSSNTASEDLTVQIVDTSARLNSSKMLRERLNALLKDRPGKLSDLLDIERELARVQAEIDSTESVIAALKARVGMSTLTISYEPKTSAVSESVWRPLSSAFRGFLPNIVGSLAGLVEFVSAALIWIVILAAIVWFLIRRFRKAGGAKAGVRSDPSSPPTPLGPKGPRPV
jgi:hypothetical protein